MRIKIRYRFLFIAILLFMVDFGLTWYFLNFTPYVEEGNPLFAIDGGYISLFVNLVYLVFVFIIGCKVEHYDTIVVKANNSYDYFKKLWKSEQLNFTYISFLTAFVFASFTSRLSVIVDWIIYGIYQRNFYSTGYALIRERMPFGRYDIVTALLSFLIFVSIWYKIEFRKSKSISKINTDCNGGQRRACSID